jgi:hypothetical protein
MLDENIVYNTIGISKYYLLFPQLFEGQYLQALSNFVFLDMHRRDDSMKSVKIQTQQALWILNDYYNTQFLNETISYLYNQWLSNRYKILSNNSSIEYDGQFIFDGQYVPDSIDYLVQRDNETIDGINIKFKKKSNSQIEMAVKLEKGLKDG